MVFRRLKIAACFHYTIVGRTIFWVIDETLAIALLSWLRVRNRRGATSDNVALRSAKVACVKPDYLNHIAMCLDKEPNQPNEQ